MPKVLSVKPAIDEVENLNKKYYEKVLALVISEKLSTVLLQLQPMFQQFAYEEVALITPFLNYAAMTAYKEITEENLMGIVNSPMRGLVYDQRVYTNKAGIASRLERDLQLIVRGEAHSLEDIKKTLRKDFNISLNDSTRIVRTETNRVFNAATIQRYVDAGETEIGLSVRLDDRTSKVCRALNGYKFPLERGKYPILPLHPNERTAYRAPKKTDKLFTGDLQKFIEANS
ncbi:MAG: minor capsid protein [Aeromonadaceae bacterium]